MANPTFKRIKDLSLEKTSVADNDWFVLEDSEDSFKTKKVKGQYIGANIYKNDGTLTGNRTVTMSGNSLTFSGGTVKTISPSASALDVAFSVRNNTDTSDIFKVLGNTQMGVNGTNANSQFNINNTTFAWGLSVFQNKAFEDAIYISAVSGRAGYFISNSAVGVEAVNETGANYAINALGKYDGTGKALKTFGEVRMDGLQTYADNATAVVALGTNRLYYRTGHGLDITV